jgi:hypothetical protein
MGQKNPPNTLAVEQRIKETLNNMESIAPDGVMLFL